MPFLLIEKYYLHHTIGTLSLILGRTSQLQLLHTKLPLWWQTVWQESSSGRGYRAQRMYVP